MPPAAHRMLMRGCTVAAIAFATTLVESCSPLSSTSLICFADASHHSPHAIDLIIDIYGNGTLVGNNPLTDGASAVWSFSTADASLMNASGAIPALLFPTGTRITLEGKGEDPIADHCAHPFVLRREDGREGLAGLVLYAPPKDTLLTPALTPAISLGALIRKVLLSGGAIVSPNGAGGDGNSMRSSTTHTAVIPFSEVVGGESLMCRDMALHVTLQATLYPLNVMTGGAKMRQGEEGEDFSRTVTVLRWDVGLNATLALPHKKKMISLWRMSMGNIALIPPPTAADHGSGGHDNKNTNTNEQEDCHHPAREGRERALAFACNPSASSIVNLSLCFEHFDVLLADEAAVHHAKDASTPSIVASYRYNSTDKTLEQVITGRDRTLEPDESHSAPELSSALSPSEASGKEKRFIPSSSHHQDRSDGGDDNRYRHQHNSQHFFDEYASSTFPLLSASKRARLSSIIRSFGEVFSRHDGLMGVSDEEIVHMVRYGHLYIHHDRQAALGTMEGLSRSSAPSSVLVPASSPSPSSICYGKSAEAPLSREVAANPSHPDTSSQHPSAPLDAVYDKCPVDEEGEASITEETRRRGVASDVDNGAIRSEGESDAEKGNEVIPHQHVKRTCHRRRDEENALYYLLDHLLPLLEQHRQLEAINNNHLHGSDPATALTRTYPSSLHHSHTLGDLIASQVLSSLGAFSRMQWNSRGAAAVGGGKGGDTHHGGAYFPTPSIAYIAHGGSSDYNGSTATNADGHDPTHSFLPAFVSLGAFINLIGMLLVIASFSVLLSIMVWVGKVRDDSIAHDSNPLLGGGGGGGAMGASPTSFSISSFSFLSSLASNHSNAGGGVQPAFSGVFGGAFANSGSPPVMVSSAGGAQIGYGIGSPLPVHQQHVFSSGIRGIVHTSPHGTPQISPQLRPGTPRSSYLLQQQVQMLFAAANQQHQAAVFNAVPTGDSLAKPLGGAGGEEGTPSTDSAHHQQQPLPSFIPPSLVLPVATGGGGQLSVSSPQEVEGGGGSDDGAIVSMVNTVSDLSSPDATAGHGGDDTDSGEEDTERFSTTTEEGEEAPDDDNGSGDGDKDPVGVSEGSLPCLAVGRTDSRGNAAETHHRQTQGQAAKDAKKPPHRNAQLALQVQSWQEDTSSSSSSDEEEEEEEESDEAEGNATRVINPLFDDVEVVERKAVSNVSFNTPNEAAEGGNGGGNEAPLSPSDAQKQKTTPPRGTRRRKHAHHHRGVGTAMTGSGLLLHSSSSGGAFRDQNATPITTNSMPQAKGSKGSGNVTGANSLTATPVKTYTLSSSNRTIIVTATTVPRRTLKKKQRALSKKSRQSTGTPVNRVDGSSSSTSSPSSSSSSSSSSSDDANKTKRKKKNNADGERRLLVRTHTAEGITDQWEDADDETEEASNDDADNDDDDDDDADSPSQHDGTASSSGHEEEEGEDDDDGRDSSECAALSRKPAAVAEAKTVEDDYGDPSDFGREESSVTPTYLCNEHAMLTIDALRQINAAGGQYGAHVFKDDYEIVKKIGNGVDGSVFVVKSKLTTNYYAVKAICLAGDAEKRKREALLHSRLDHSCIPRFYHTWIEEMPVSTIISFDMFPDTDSLLDYASMMDKEEGGRHGGGDNTTSSFYEDREAEASEHGGGYKFSMGSDDDTVERQSSVAPTEDSNSPPAAEKQNKKQTTNAKAVTNKVSESRGAAGAAASASSPSAALTPVPAAYEVEKEAIRAARDLREAQRRNATVPVLFIKMEYFRAGTLRDFLSHRCQYNYDLDSREWKEAAWRMFLSVAKSLKYLHDRQIIHRDVKPSNIFIGNGKFTAHYSQQYYYKHYRKGAVKVKRPQHQHGGVYGSNDDDDEMDDNSFVGGGSFGGGLGIGGAEAMAMLEENEDKGFWEQAGSVMDSGSFIGADNAPLPTLKLGDFGRSLDTSDPDYKKEHYESKAGVPHGMNFSRHDVFDGTFCFGSVPYSSPEQMNGQLLGFATDIFSLGVVALEIFQNFKTESEKMRVLNKLIHCNDHHSKVLDRLPEPMTGKDEFLMIANMLAYKPGDRPKISYIIRGIEKILEGYGGYMGGSAAFPPLPAPGGSHHMLMLYQHQMQQQQQQVYGGTMGGGNPLYPYPGAGYFATSAKGTNLTHASAVGGVAGGSGRVMRSSLSATFSEAELFRSAAPRPLFTTHVGTNTFGNAANSQPNANNATIASHMSSRTVHSLTSPIAVTSSNTLFPKAPSSVNTPTASSVNTSVVLSAAGGGEGPPPPASSSAPITAVASSNSTNDATVDTRQQASPKTTPLTKDPASRPPLLSLGCPSEGGGGTALRASRKRRGHAPHSVSPPVVVPSKPNVNIVNSNGSRDIATPMADTMTHTPMRDSAQQQPSSSASPPSNSVMPSSTSADKSGFISPSSAPSLSVMSSFRVVTANRQHNSPHQQHGEQSPPAIGREAVAANPQDEEPNAHHRSASSVDARFVDSVSTSAIGDGDDGDGHAQRSGATPPEED